MRLVTALVFGVVAGAAVAECAVRLGLWDPPVQIVRGYGLRELDGVPVWEYTTDRYNRECVEQHPERIRILFLGSSITYGQSLRAGEAFTADLQARLNAADPSPGFCVLNFAQPAFAFEQKLAMARVEVARYRPALILWEDWVEWQQYRMIGDAAYSETGLRIRDDGTVGFRFVPDALNGALFRHSRVYQYLALVFGERRPETAVSDLRAFYNEALGQLVALARSVDAGLVLFLAVPLDRPFAASVAAPPAWHAPILDFARTHDVPVYSLQEELVEEDYLAVRLDPCCHFNAAGHRALVPVMERIVRRHLPPG